MNKILEKVIQYGMLALITATTANAIIEIRTNLSIHDKVLETMKKTESSK